MTHKEIANKLSISPAALSLIINNRPGVSDTTRNRVLSSLHDMGLDHLIKSSASAKSNSNNLGFIIYKRDGNILDLHPFFLLLMENIENHAKKYGYNILLNIIDKRRPLDEQIEHLCELNIAGIILFATEMHDEDITPFKKMNIPYVALDNALSRLNCNSIAINNKMGTYQAISYLVETGHNRIGYIKSDIRINSFRERHMGYLEALKHFSYTLAPDDIWTVQYLEDGSYRDIKEYLKSRSPDNIPDAFVCDDDITAIGAIRAFTELGYRIPEDISIIGFNDRPLCENSMPSLTSINVSKNELAMETVDELIKMINNYKNKIPESRSRKILIGTYLVVRDSVFPRKQI